MQEFYFCTQKTEKLSMRKFHLHILEFYLGFLLASFLHNFAWSRRSIYVQVCKSMYVHKYVQYLRDVQPLLTQIMVKCFGKVSLVRLIICLS
jgi:hypothetical protein